MSMPCDIDTAYVPDGGRVTRKMKKDDSGKYALIREEKLIEVFDDTATAIEEGHRRFGSNFLDREISNPSEDVCLEVLPAFPEEDAGK